MTRSPVALIFLVAVAALTQVSAGTGAEHVRRHAHTHAGAYTTNEIAIRARLGTNVARLEAQLSARGLSLGSRIPHTRVFAVHTRGMGAITGDSEQNLAAIAAAHKGVYRRIEVPKQPTR